MKNALIVRSISSTDVELDTWYPETMEDVFVSLDIEVEFSDGNEGINLFYVTLATPEALSKHRTPPILVEHRTIVVSEYSYDIVRKAILNIAEKCTRKTWEESCLALQRYFQWEYEDYVLESN